MPRRSVVVVAVGLCLWIPPDVGYGQDAVRLEQAAPSQPSGLATPPVVRPPGQPLPAEPRPAPSDGKPPQAKQAEPGKAEQDKDQKKDEEKEEDKVTKRPSQPPTPPDPEELKVRPDENGQIRFSFHGQPWPDVLQWLAEVSGMSLDWQEVPADYLNLTTQHHYDLDEARDLINRHLLARGFTILQHREGLSVVNIKKLNPALVPRVEPAQLENQLPHEFVKVSFALEWLLAEDASKELAPMLSPNGKLTPLKNTNRLEAIDAVINLREIYRLLQEEQSAEGKNRLAREFVLLHSRAEDVRRQLETFLGLEQAKQPATPLSPQQLAAMQQQAQMMAQRQAQRQAQVQAAGQQAGVSAAKPQAKVSMVANVRRNSLLVHAPPDKMAIIASFIELVDVPSEHATSLDALTTRMKTYRLATLDPQQLVSSLEELGGLDPTTRLRVDEKNKAIIAYASVADHFMIQSVIEKLDGSSRRFEVVPLRKHAADEVAGSIEFLMGSGRRNERQSRYGYDFPFIMSSRSRSPDQDTDQFRVSANLEYNQLILWCNDVEYEEVTNLLVKLGELPSRDGRGRRVRVIDAARGQELIEFFEKLQRDWPSLAPNPLMLPGEEELKEPEPKRPAQDEEPGQRDGNLPGQLKTTRNEPRPADQPPLPQRFGSGPILRLAQLQRPPKSAAATGQSRPDAASPVDAGQVQSTGPPAQQRGLAPQADTRPPLPPIRITVGPDGQLIISSEDTRALDLLEEYMAQMAPRRKNYKVFHLKYAPAYWVRLNLEDFFEEEEQDDSRDRYMSWWYGVPPTPRTRESRQLGKRRPIRFIDDPDTNTILVQGADPSQLKTIEELIELYDVEEPVNAQNARVTKLFAIRYSKAQIIADTIKDAYRDLLSSNDRALLQYEQSKQQRQAGGGATYIRNYGFGDDEPQTKTQITFQGKLSIGVDQVSNTLLVSTEGESLMDVVGRMIEELDKSAQPVADVQVMQLQGDINSEQLRRIMERILDLPPSTAPRGQVPQPAEPQPAPRPPAVQPGPGNVNAVQVQPQ